MDVLETLEGQISALEKQLVKLKAATNLQAVQIKLDGFMEEVRLLHRGFLATLEDMIKGLNAEGVKRYEGAVKAVNDNVNVQIAGMKAELNVRN